MNDKPSRWENTEEIESFERPIKEALKGNFKPGSKFILKAMSKQEELKLKAYRLFCQHCQALQKTMGWKGKPCWATQYNEPEAVCASAIDAVDGLFNHLHENNAVIKVDTTGATVAVDEFAIKCAELGLVAVEPIIDYTSKASQQ